MSLPPSVSTGQTASGLAYLDIHSPLCDARVFLQGAHLTHFQPKGQGPLLWLSPSEDFARGRAIRGGVPVCWPWFGNNKPSPEAPAHGYARTCEWHLVDVEDRDGEVIIQFSLPMDALPQQHWPHSCELSLVMVLGKTARLTLTTDNTGHSPLLLTQALHSYFPVPDIDQVQVLGLDGSQYWEAGTGPLPQAGTVRIDRELDRQYQCQQPLQQIDTGQGLIRVKREGSHSLVLWNPWVDKAKALGQFPDDGYRQMLCLEAANVGGDAVTLAPGQQHSLVTELGWA
ncbi:D-hexose-6-phosphate mutarotase [Gallaecimonas xiamenensis]|uniref:Putative glucose-6-phosphate 1-epimerase n=1 Tax=Gallaecimonas xiamenensis 3-C-1 TaxID=745411 RepID=K2J6T4_9GAMM|nr:D-hexose-6-phosphate mutarotase [Gallaecimonas xiamenensis]EKE70627.1 aldose 1-epimerase [Gallaecimonas xiamenensis 3-C-1]